MGGLWIDYDQMTNKPGLFAAGECEYQYHGANRLGANSLVSCIYGGFVAGRTAGAFARNQAKSAAAVASTVYEREQKRQEGLNQELLQGKGGENPFHIWKEMGDLMTEHATVVRHNKGLKKADEMLVKLIERSKRLNLSDRSQWANQTLAFCRELTNMLHIARVIVQGAEARNESRGAHYKPDFPDRNDAEWMKTTLANFDAAKSAPVLTYEAVDAALITPRPRKYDAA